MKPVNALMLTGIVMMSMGMAWASTAQAQDAGSSTVASQAMPSYRPPMRGAPASRLGGAHRGAEGDDWTLLVLAPEHTGQTTAAQPTLYWYTSKDVEQPVEITLIARGAIDPLLEHTLKGPVSAGVQRLALADLGVSLKPGTEYQWFVSVIMDPTQRSQDYTAGAAIQRVAADQETQARLQNAPAEELAFIYAQAGLWFDAIDSLSQRINSSPTDAVARQQRQALVQQVGLKLPKD